MSATAATLAAPPRREPPPWVADVTVSVGPLAPAEWAQVAALLARGMRDNPLHVAAFGTDPVARQARLERLFGPTLAMLDWPQLTARHPDGTLVGVAGLAAPGACRPTAGQQLRLIPTLLRLGPRVAGRVGRWQAVWAKHHPRERHWHLGGTAVDAHLQGLGIGGRLLTAFCAQADAAGDVAYLETDTARNVRFYARFGFEVIAEAPVLGVPNWFMRRAPRSVGGGSHHAP
jgi:GNAT superfamily N-acetyltransferase